MLAWHQISLYRVASWQKAQREVSKVESHGGELFPRWGSPYPRGAGGIREEGRSFWPRRPWEESNWLFWGWMGAFRRKKMHFHRLKIDR